jgi:hypothetical protein
MEIRQDLIGSDAGQQQWAGLLAEYLGRGFWMPMSSPDIRMESSQCGTAMRRRPDWPTRLGKGLITRSSA